MRGTRALCLVALTSTAGCGILLGSGDDVAPASPGDAGPSPEADSESTTEDASSGSDGDPDPFTPPDGGGKDVYVPEAGGHIAFVTSASGPASKIRSLPLAEAACDSLVAVGPYKGRHFTPLVWYADAAAPSPAARLDGGGPWYRTDGVLIGDLGSGGLVNALDVDQTGTKIDGGELVWTGAPLNAGDVPVNCAEWTATLGLGEVGDPALTDKGFVRSTTQSCKLLAHVYCVEIEK